MAGSHPKRTPFGPAHQVWLNQGVFAQNGGAGGVVQPGGYTDASAGGLCKERHEPMDERQLVALQMLPFVKQHPTREAAAIDAAEAEERWVERERFAKRSLAGRPGGGIAGGGANLRPRVEEASLNPRRARERSSSRWASSAPRRASR